MGDYRDATPGGRACTIASRPPRRDGACRRRAPRRRDHRDRRCGVRRHLLPRVFRPAGITVLTVRCELYIDVLALELYELEVTEPRDDFELEVVFFFKQKTAYEIGLGIPAEPLFRSSRNATSLNSRFKSLDTLKVKIISVTFRRVIRTNHKKASKIWRHENIQLGGCQS